MRALQPRSRRVRLALLAVPALLLTSVVAIAGGVLPATAVDPTTTLAATTTLAPTTTTPPTTAPATTTTEKPTTTTSSSTSTSTTSSSTTTTVPPKPASSDSDTPWGLIIGILVAVAAIALLAATLIRNSQKKKNIAQWLLVARPARDDAAMVRDMLLGAGAERGTSAPQDVTVQADAAALELDRATASAPDDTRRDASAAVAASLRGLQFAIESEALLRSGATPPTADQLAQADVNHRTRARELDQSLARLGELIPPPEGTPPPPN